MHKLGYQLVQAHIITMAVTGIIVHHIIATTTGITVIGKRKVPLYQAGLFLSQPKTITG
jgi:hypothetical protein